MTRDNFSLVLERENEHVDASLVDGKVHLTVSIDNDLDKGLETAMKAWLAGQQHVVIRMGFGLKDVLHTAIEFGRVSMAGDSDELEWDQRPLFAAWKAELVEMIRRIDSLQFAGPEEAGVGP